MVARPPFALSLALGIALAATAPSLPAGEPDPVAYAATIASLMRQGGFPEVTTIEGTFGSKGGQSFQHELSLEAGQRLIVFACGDEKASDIDLSVTAPDGRSWEDTLSDARPLVELTATVPGTYQIEVISFSIEGDSCAYVLLHATRN